MRPSEPPPRESGSDGPPGPRITPASITAARASDAEGVAGPQGGPGRTLLLPPAAPAGSAPATPVAAPAYPSRASGTMQPARTSTVGAPAPPAAPSPSGAPRPSNTTGIPRGSGFTGRFSRASLRAAGNTLRTSVAAVRKSLLSILPPLPMSKSAWYAPVATLVMLGAAILGLGYWLWSTGRMPESVSAALRLPPSPRAVALVPPPLVEADAEVDDAVPDVKFGRGNVLGGVLSIPTSFAPAEDGAFDLVIHAHGNPDLATESYEAVGIGAAVYVLNLGIGSGAYEDRFQDHRALGDAIGRATKGVAERGVANAHVRRLAMVSWSAGYGAALRSLNHGPHADRIDAILLLDGLHAGFRSGSRTLDPLPIEPMIRYAERAVRGEKLLVITHSNIDPVDYLGVKETTDYLLKELKVERQKVEGSTQLPILRAMEGVMAKADMVALEKRSEARAGNLVVRGYAGSQPTHHVSHLMQMSQIALPLLVERWR